MPKSKLRAAEELVDDPIWITGCRRWVWCCTSMHLPPAVDRSALSGDEWARAAPLASGDRSRAVRGWACWLAPAGAMPRPYDSSHDPLPRQRRQRQAGIGCARASALNFNLCAFIRTGRCWPSALIEPWARIWNWCDPTPTARPSPAGTSPPVKSNNGWLGQAAAAPGFYAGWTRKEISFVKALGGGTSIALDGFEIALDPDQPAALRSIGGSGTAAARWSIGTVTWPGALPLRWPPRAHRLRFNRLDDDT